MSDPLLIFKQSYARIQGGPHGEDWFYDRFLDRFLNADPRIPGYFVRIDRRRQRQMLCHSIVLAAQFAITRQVTPTLRQYRELHGPAGLAVPAALFGCWVEALCGAVAESDPECDDEILIAWRVTVASLVTYLSAPSSGEWKTSPAVLSRIGNTAST